MASDLFLSNSVSGFDYNEETFTEVEEYEKVVKDFRVKK